MTPSHVRYSSGWSSVWTAMRFSPGTSGMPLGTAHETATPSRSSRRSQCSRVALCSCTTKRSPAAASSPAGAGSGEARKSRLRRYSFSWSGVFLGFFVGVTVGSAVRLVLALLGEAVEGNRVLGVLGVLDQEVLGLLEALLLAAAGLVHGLPGGIVAAVLVCLHALQSKAPRRARPTQGGVRASAGTGTGSDMADREVVVVTGATSGIVRAI